MTKTFKMQDLDCANCARKMEDAIRKLEGVAEVHVNFLTQKMEITADDGVMADVLKAAEKIVKKIEPDVEFVVK